MAASPRLDPRTSGFHSRARPGPDAALGVIRHRLGGLHQFLGQGASLLRGEEIQVREAGIGHDVHSCGPRARSWLR